jgi:Holliday junction DNA helicase RuvA
VIGSLRGVLLHRHLAGDATGEALVEVGGVGYRVVMAAGVVATVGEPGSPVFLHVHTRVREDAIVLYGFPTAEEKTCFEALIGAHGVGPAMALALLSVHSPPALRLAVAAGDAGALTVVPGVGPKTAARLLVELKAKFGDDELDGAGGGVDAAGPAAAGGARADVRAALTGLGYGGDEVRAALAALPEDGDAADLLRMALRQLSRSR